MKLIDKFINIKKSYTNTIVLVKSGTFYVTYNDDAYIMGYLMNYQVNDNNKLGFPKNTLDKILLKLDECKINVYIIDEDISKEYTDNQYSNILHKARKEHFNDLNAKLLIDEIKLLIEDNPANILKIRSFISEL